jgi:hypothetical protein
VLKRIVETRMNVVTDPREWMGCCYHVHVGEKETSVIEQVWNA